MPEPNDDAQGWLRWGPVALAVAMAVTLVGSQLASMLDVRDAARTIEHGQAEGVLHAVHARLARTSVTLDKLERVLAEHRASGLFAISVVGPRERISTGAVLARHAPPPRTGEIQRVGDRLRLAQPLAPAPGQRPLPPRLRFLPRLADEPGARPPWPPPPTMLVIEIRPSLGAEVADTAHRALAIGVIAALLVLALGLSVSLLARRRAELMRAAERDRQLAALGQMSAVLAHEIRNPLASLKGHAQLLEEVLPDGRDKDKAARVVREAQRLEALVSNLLELVRTGRVRRRKVDPREVVRAAAETVDPDAFVLALERAPHELSLNPDALERALENVMRNAAQASPAPISVAVSEEDGALVIEVRDRGPGIPEAELPRIFDAFHTTRTQGTGLGLAVARRVIEAHGGTIEAHDHPEGGAVLTLRIPNVEGD